MYPVETILFSRTRMAPTRRFMQFERREAREARVWGGGRKKEEEEEDVSVVRMKVGDGKGWG